MIKKIIHLADEVCLRDLKINDIFLTRIETKMIYLKKLENDKHLIQSLDIKSIPFVVPHGNFPSRKILN